MNDIVGLKYNNAGVLNILPMVKQARNFSPYKYILDVHSAPTQNCSGSNKFVENVNSNIL